LAFRSEAIENYFVFLQKTTNFKKYGKQTLTLLGVWTGENSGAVENFTII
jgi:hypothetical protein